MGELSSAVGDEQLIERAVVAEELGAPAFDELGRLAGLEPHITDRVLTIPALEELRKVVTERLRVDQAAGQVRTDIDPVAIAGGIVSIMLSLLMSVVQLGTDAVAAYGGDIGAVFAAALDPIKRRSR